ncbi:MAG: hypothetical protein Kow0068_08320 [Marinilabiliales bacterium]
MQQLGLCIFFLIFLCASHNSKGQDFDLEKTFNSLLNDSQRTAIKSRIENYNQQINDDSINAVLYLNRGVEYSKLGLYPKAIKDYNLCIKYDSLIPEAFYNRGLANARFRYTKDACKDIRHAYELGLEVAKQTYLKNCGLYFKDLGNIE